MPLHCRKAAFVEYHSLRGLERSLSTCQNPVFQRLVLGHHIFQLLRQGVELVTKVLDYLLFAPAKCPLSAGDINERYSSSTSKMAIHTLLGSVLCAFAVCMSC